jgi:putative transposase
LWDATITAVLASYCVERDEHGRRRPESLYGSLKMWAHLRRQGIEVARCTWSGSCVSTGGVVPPGRRGFAPPCGSYRCRRPPDLVDRNFRVDRPDALYVADFTYVRMVPGFATRRS